MNVDITVLCEPPDPKDQPKITDFFYSKNSPAQTKITSFFQSPSPTRHRARKTPLKVLEEHIPGPSTSADASDDPDDQSAPTKKIKTTAPEQTTKRRVGRPRKIPDTTPKVKRPVGRPRKTPLSNTAETPGAEDVAAEERPIKQTTNVPPTDEVQVPTDILVHETIVQTTKSLNEGAPPSSKRKRCSYTVQQKQEVVEYAKKHSVYRASKHYKLSCGTIGPWMSKEFSKMDGSSFRSTGCGRKLSYSPEFEPQITQWILEQRDTQPNLSTQDIISYACSIIQPTYPTFKGTRGWLQKFMVRNNLINADISPLSKSLPPLLEEKITVFLETIKKARSEYGYVEGLVGNMDEVSVQIDMASNRRTERSRTTVFPTYKVGDEKQSYTVGAEKQHLTAVLTAMADGTLLPPMVIFKGAKFPKNIIVPSDWIVCAQENAQLDSYLMDTWIKEIWLKHTQDKEALLILDSFHPLCTEDYQSLLVSRNTTVGHIPHGCSSKLQPVAVSLAAPFKETCNKYSSIFYHSQLNSLTNPGDKLRSASREDICLWLQEAYKHLTEKPELVMKSFKATGLTLALDGSEDHLFRRNSTSDEVQELEKEVMAVNTEQDKVEATQQDAVKDAEHNAVKDVAFDELDGSLKTLYNYMLEIQNKAVDMPPYDQLQAQ